MTFSKLFVCEDTKHSTFTHHVPAPLFRKSFHLQQRPTKGEITLCGLGFYDLFINGKRITKGYLAPYISNSDDIIYYDTYDLLPFLNVGENVIGIMLGDGFQNGKTATWEFVDNTINSAPKLALQVSIKAEKNIEFDASDFCCKKGPIWFNDLRSGVFYDARKQEVGWTQTEYVQDNTWHAPLITDTPKGEARLCEADPIVITKEIKPISIVKGTLAPYSEDGGTITPAVESAPPKAGGYIYDFGENNAGIFRLKIKGTRGQRVDIQCAEKLTADGKADYSNIYYFPDGYAQRDIYILSGEDEEVFEPMFTYHGYRYLYISGITPEQATEDLLTYLVMRSDLKQIGSFSCSDDLANKICDAAMRSDLSNFYYFPTDCPHREKNGWTGDAALSAEHMALTLSFDKSMHEWLRNIRKAQREDGGIPGIIPTGGWGYELFGPVWDCVIFEIPYRLYQYRGDTHIIKENADLMLSYLKYLSNKRNDLGLIEYGLGDFMSVDRIPVEYACPLRVACSMAAYDICQKATLMFKAIHKNPSAFFAQDLAKSFLTAIRTHLIDKTALTIEGDCQTAQALGLYYNIFTDEERPAAFQKLLHIIHRDEERMTGGILGLRTIFHVLSSNNESELAYRMITRLDAPSYGNWVSRGNTTLPEQFLSSDCNWLRSDNHHFFGDVLHWFMRWIGGLQIIDHNNVVIAPHFIHALQSADATHILPAGEISVHWERKNDEITLTLSHPKEIQCTVQTAENIKICRTTF